MLMPIPISTRPPTISAIRPRRFPNAWPLNIPAMTLRMVMTKTETTEDMRYRGSGWLIERLIPTARASTLVAIAPIMTFLKPQSSRGFSSLLRMAFRSMEPPT